MLVDIVCYRGPLWIGGGGGGGGRGIMDVLVEPYILLFHITQEIS